ncbi:MAG: cyclase family protein [Proteobacteria bacterium]|nr:cyclase family protein [Pseudomonadota bacterium]
MAAKTLLDLITGISAGSIRIVDLTQPLHARTPLLSIPPEFGQSWPFKLEEISKYDDRGPGWYWNNFSCGEHTGTHFDVPIHWVTGKDHTQNATDTVPNEAFIGAACVIDAVADCRVNPDFLVSVDYLKKWEAVNGTIPTDSWVLFRTDWSKKFDSDEFINAQADGSHTPGWEPDAVRFLAEERNVKGAGVETVGTDAGQSFNQDPRFPCHNLMHGANKYGLAALCNLDQLPPTGAVVIAAPLKIQNGSGSPCRALALVPA